MRGMNRMRGNGGKGIKHGVVSLVCWIVHSAQRTVSGWGYMGLERERRTSYSAAVCCLLSAVTISTAISGRLRRRPKFQCEL
mmetsp:Transcript_26940/g.59636  ORF Transcript_26940/g.59636 Transcript_26940/m.59636 type:complete len:82 (+) Transcript_26940:22-267(+)